MIEDPRLILILDFVKSQGIVSYRKIQIYLRTRGIRISKYVLREDLSVLKSLGYVSIPSPGFYKAHPERDLRFWSEKGQRLCE